MHYRMYAYIQMDMHGWKLVVLHDGTIEYRHKKMGTTKEQ